MNTSLASPILDRLTTLSDETRTRILALVERSEFTVTELCAVLQTPQPTVSRHLRTLADDGWVSVRAEGRNRHYRLSSELDEASRELWRLVREELGSDGIYANDAERAREVLADRRRRSAQFFAESAHRWDTLRLDLFGERAEVLPLFGLLDPDWTVGDLGSGTGGLVALLAPLVSRVIGVDRSAEMLAAAGRRLEGVGNAELREGTLEALPLGDGELDVAILALALHYVVDPPEVLAEVRRVLRPGGRLVVLDMRSHERGAEYAEEMGHVWPGFEPDRMAAWMRDARFGRVSVRALPPDPRALGPPLFLASGVRT